MVSLKAEGDVGLRSCSELRMCKTVLVLMLLVRGDTRNSLKLRAEPAEARVWIGSWERG